MFLFLKNFDKKHSLQSILLSDKYGGDNTPPFFMKINLWYSKSMEQWRWTLVEEWKNGITKTEQHSGQQPFLRDAMEDVANTVEYMLECKDKGD